MDLQLKGSIAKNHFLIDIVFYEVALSKAGSFLVTGNIKHFPKNPIVVTPSEFLRIIGVI